MKSWCMMNEALACRFGGRRLAEASRQYSIYYYTVNYLTVKNLHTKNF